MVGELENIHISTDNGNYVYVPQTSQLLPARHLSLRTDAGDQNTYRDLCCVLAERPFPLTVLQVSPTLGCNMCCSYCYGSDKGEFMSGGYMQGAPPDMMTPEVAGKAIEFLLAESAGRQYVQCAILGGEPLLNYDTVMHLIRHGNELTADSSVEIYWSIGTNATLLDQKRIDELLGQGVRFHVSIDGPSKWHDSRRHMRNGQSSHKDVVRNIKLIQMSPFYQPDMLRFTGVFDADMAEAFDEILSYFEQEWPGVHVMLQPDIPRDPNATTMIRLISRYFQHLLEDGQPWWELSFFGSEEILDLRRGRKRFFGERSVHGLRQLDVDPAGDIYPSCFLFRDGQFRLGNVMDPHADRRQTNCFFADRCVDSHSSVHCHACWAKYLCGGGSFYEHYRRTGSYTKRDPTLCSETRSMWLAALVEYAAFMEHRGALSKVDAMWRQ